MNFFDMMYKLWYFGMELIFYLVSVGYPAYATYETLDLKLPSEMRKWLQFWAVYGTITLVEFMVEKVMGLGMTYWVAKFIIHLWLSVFGGGRYMYKYCFRPIYDLLFPWEEMGDAQ